MAALSLYHRVTGDWQADVERLATEVRNFWGAGNAEALEVARHEMDQLRAELEAAPSLTEARQTFALARQRAYDRPRDTAARDAADAAHRAMLAAECRERLAGRKVDKPGEAKLIDEILGAE